MPEPMTQKQLVALMVEVRLIFNKGSPTYTIEDMMVLTRARNRSHLLLAIEALKKVKDRKAIIKKLPDGKYKCFYMGSPSKSNMPNTETVSKFAIAHVKGMSIGYIIIIIWMLWIIFPKI